MTKANNDYADTMVGDQWDISPYPVDNPVMGISASAYIKNMVYLSSICSNNLHTRFCY